uniref:DUF3306 domain-containing protein n=1 Tax=Macrostomum lignano TaxID=282301 RepID=A0A1I8H074_9PLAT
VILSDESISIRYIRKLVAKKQRLGLILEKLQPRVFTEADARVARRTYQTQDIETGSASDTEAFFEAQAVSEAEGNATFKLADVAHTAAQLLPMSPPNEVETVNEPPEDHEVGEDDADSAPPPLRLIDHPVPGNHSENATQSVNQS